MFRLVELSPGLVPACVRILQDEWPKVTEERLRQVVAYGHDGSGFPCSLVMVEDQTPTEVLAHCRVIKVLNYPNSSYIESIVVSRPRRGHGLGRKILNLSEDYLKSRGISRMILSCLVSNASIFIHHGYRYCEADVATLGSAMLGSSGPPPYTAPLPGWEHLYADVKPPSNLMDQERIRDESNEKGNTGGKQSELKIRTIKYLDTPMLSPNTLYTWLAKELSQM